MTPEEQAIVDAVTMKLQGGRYVAVPGDEGWAVVDFQTGRSLFDGMPLSRANAELTARQYNVAYTPAP